MNELLLRIDRCLAAIGTGRFSSEYFDLVKAIQIDQIMVFSLAHESCACLLSMHFHNSPLGIRLAADYLNGWYRKDPLFPVLMAMKRNNVLLRRLDEFSYLMGTDYRKRFFDVPGLRNKTTLLVSGENRQFIVNLYQCNPDTLQIEDDVARIVGRLAILHFDRLEHSAIPSPLMALSVREQEVCMGILSGKKSETIAGALGITASTVITYRKRAYKKLGIASRAELFSICAR